jgi:hypothetical protein
MKDEKDKAEDIAALSSFLIHPSSFILHPFKKGD